jgi:hypothetical protein
MDRQNPPQQKRLSGFIVNEAMVAEVPKRMFPCCLCSLLTLIFFYDLKKIVTISRSVPTKFLGNFWAQTHASTHASTGRQQMNPTLDKISRFTCACTGLDSLFLVLINTLLFFWSSSHNPTPIRSPAVALNKGNAHFPTPVYTYFVQKKSESPATSLGQ